MPKLIFTQVLELPFKRELYPEHWTLQQCIEYEEEQVGEVLDLNIDKSTFSVVYTDSDVPADEVSRCQHAFTTGYQKQGGQS